MTKYDKIFEYISNNVMNENFTFEVEDAINLSGCNVLSRMKHTAQDPEWHQEGNVEIHTNMVIKEAIKLTREHNLDGHDSMLLVCAALFHDIGKVFKTVPRVIDGKERITSKGHASVSASEVFFNLNTHPQVKRQLCSIIYYHHDVLKLLKTDNQYKFHQVCTFATGRLLYLLEVADFKGRICDDKDEKLQELEEFNMFATEYGVDGNSISVLDSVLLMEIYNETNDQTSASANRKNNIPERDHVYWRAAKILMNGEESDYWGAYLKAFNQFDPKDKKIIILCGISGSGKSTIAKGFRFNDKEPLLISPDDYLIGKGTSKENRVKSYRQAQETLHRNFSIGTEFIVWDATSRTKQSRSKLIEKAERYGYITEIIMTTTTINDAIKNNKNRDIEKVLSDDVIKSQVNSFELPEISEADIVTYFQPLLK